MSIAVGYQHPGWVHEGFMRSMMRLHDERAELIEWTIGMRSGSLLGPGRSEILRTFLGTEATHLLYVDTDMIFTPEDVGGLLARAEALVGGLYLGQRTDGSRFATAQTFSSEGFAPLHPEAVQAAAGGLVAVDGMGMGFTLVRRDVAEALADAYPHPFEETWISGFHTDPDVAFCARALSRGFQPYVDTAVRLGHIKEHVI
jgi:hypothetical protein